MSRSFPTARRVVKKVPSFRWRSSSATSPPVPFQAPGPAGGHEADSHRLEYSYKDDELGDPLINDYHIAAMELATKEELDPIAAYAFKINDILNEYLKDLNIDLVDFKLEFGKTRDGTIVLADEISPDTCRFWDATTHEKLDKDRFRRDMDDVDEGYHEIMKRLLGE